MRQALPGAFIASASIPGESSKSDDDLGGYHLVWTRDMIQSASALLACGRTETAPRLVYLACSQRRRRPFRHWIDGTPYWTSIQLDESAFPIILAWRLWKLDALGGADIVPFVLALPSFLVRYARSRSKSAGRENAGYSPSTLAVVISALICVADISHDKFPELGSFLGDYTRTGSKLTSTSGPPPPPAPCFPTSAYLHAHPPPAEGEPFHNPAILGMIHRNREPGERCRRSPRGHRRRLPSELVRYGVRRADDQPS